MRLISVGIRTDVKRIRSRVKVPVCHPSAPYTSSPAPFNRRGCQTFTERTRAAQYKKGTERQLLIH